MPVWKEKHVHAVDDNASELIVHFSPLPHKCVEIVARSVNGASLVRIMLPINEARTFFCDVLEVINASQPEFD